MGNKQSNNEKDEHNLDAIKNHDEKTKMQIRGIQSLFKLFTCNIYFYIKSNISKL